VQSVGFVGKSIFLPADNDTWTVYQLDKPAIKNPANIAGQLAPKQFGGLTYTILRDFGNYTFEIQTSSFGYVKIYAAPDTGAIIS